MTAVETYIVTDHVYLLEWHLALAALETVLVVYLSTRLAPLSSVYGLCADDALLSDGGLQLTQVNMSYRFSYYISFILLKIGRRAMTMEVQWSKRIEEGLR